MAKAKGSVSNLVPLIILFLVLAVLAAVGFVAWTIANDVSSKTRQKMEKRNISFTKDGMKVGVKEVTSEQQQDSAQNMLVKIWNQSSFPAYKSKLGWMDGKDGSPEKRKPYGRSSSSQNNISRTTSAK